MTRYLLSAVALIATIFASVNSFSDDRAPPMKAQLTIYVDRPLLDTGGTIIVVSKPVSPEQWDALPRTSESETWKRNPKRSGMGDRDRLFEVKVSDKVAVIEFVYPDGGTFGFDLAVLPGENPANPLRTKRILVGDGYYTDRETGERHVWDDISTIYVHGPDASEGDSRAVRMASGEIMNSRPRKETNVGSVTYIPSPEALSRVVVTEPQ